MKIRSAFLWWVGIGAVALLLVVGATGSWLFTRGASRHGDATKLAGAVEAARVLPDDADEVCDVRDGLPSLTFRGVRDAASQARVLEAVRAALSRTNSESARVEFLGDRDETLRVEIVHR